MAKKGIDETIGPFHAEPIVCGVCREKEATHSISIRVDKGIEYNSKRQLYHVEYSVCGDCARDAVEVKIGAQLNLREKR